MSRASYLSLLRTWDDEQEEGEQPSVGPKGLVVTMSQDEMFTWSVTSTTYQHSVTSLTLLSLSTRRPLLDFLLLILFLPSLLTLLTVLSQRVRILRQQKRDRAPAEAVARLPVFLWGDTEKATTPPASIPGGPERPHDEESAIGAPAPAGGATESSPLLRPASPAPRSVFERARLAFPRLAGRQASSSSVGKVEGKVDQRAGLRVRFQTTECAICLSEFEKGERVMCLPCGHIFHAEEICDWLLESRRLVSSVAG